MAGRLAVAGALLLAVGMTWILAQPLWRLVRGYSDPATLPGGIAMCDRQWKHEGPLQVWTAEQASAEGPPTVVTPGPFGFLTACPWPGTGLVGTVVFVRVGDDAYVPYELRGGP